MLVLFSISAENLCLMCSIVEDFCIYGLCFHKHLNCFTRLYIFDCSKCCGGISTWTELFEMEPTSKAETETANKIDVRFRFQHYMKRDIWAHNELKFACVCWMRWLELRENSARKTLIHVVTEYCEWQRIDIGSLFILLFFDIFFFQNHSFEPIGVVCPVRRTQLSLEVIHLFRLRE